MRGRQRQAGISTVHPPLLGVASNRAFRAESPSEYCHAAIPRATAGCRRGLPWKRTGGSSGHARMCFGVRI